jgi:hypothetical protein
MLKTARLAPIVLSLWTVPALASGCLQQIDDITVEFDLPAAQSIAGTQTGGAYYVPPPPADNHLNLPPPPTATPPGRPGAPHGTIESGNLGMAPLLAHDRLSPAQRAKLQSILRQARSVEALGNETQCFELLRQAETITKGSS